MHAMWQVALRRLWLALVYLTLERNGERAAAADAGVVPPSLRDELTSFVENVLAAKREARPLSELPEPSGRDATQRAVLKSSMRVVYLTVDVCEDVKAAGTRADAPRPFIPGGGG